MSNLSIYFRKFCDKIPWLPATIGFSMFFVILWTTVIYEQDHRIVTYSEKLWADWPAHFAFANVFAYWPIHDWFQYNPLFHEPGFQYPFLPNLLSGLLQRVGISRITAFIAPSLAVSIVLVYFLARFYQSFLKSWTSVSCAMLLFFFNGGFGFAFWGLDLTNNLGLDTFVTPPRAYTDMPKVPITMMNFITSELIPQRSILHGLTVSVVLLSILKHWLDHQFSKIKTWQLALWGLSSGIIMICHLHSLLSLVIVCAFCLASSLQHWRKWLPLVISAALINISLYLVFYRDSISPAYPKFEPGGFLADYSQNWLYFITMNWGLFLPLIGIALWKQKQLRKDPFVLGSLMILILAHLFQFQPWAWDNYKLITFAHMILVIPVAGLLTKIEAKSPTLRRAAIMVFVLLCTASGLLDVWRILSPEARSYEMFSKRDYESAQILQERIAYDELVLATPEFASRWIYSLAGRRVVMGYGGWIWSWGIDSSPTTRAINQIVSARRYPKNLIDRIGIRFLILRGATRETLPWLQPTTRLPNGYYLFETR